MYNEHDWWSQKQGPHFFPSRLQHTFTDTLLWMRAFYWRVLLMLQKVRSVGGHVIVM